MEGWAFHQEREPAPDRDDRGSGWVPEPIRRTEPKIGRNDACPCGSGIKYKKCCGR
jgi:uncharacterized protein YecA (UPF0149 family)